MALVSQQFRLAVTLMDTGGNKSVLRYDMEAADYATAVTAKDDLLTALGNLTDAAIFSVSLTELFLETDFSYPADAEVENQLQLVVRIEGQPTKSATLRIPAPKDALFVASEGPDYNRADTTNAAIVTYIAMFESGAEFTISDGENIEGSGNPVLSGVRIHRKSLRG